MHSATISSSCTHLFGCFLANLTDDRLCEGGFASVEEEVDAITASPAEFKKHPRPSQWKADGDKRFADTHHTPKALECVCGQNLLLTTLGASVVSR